jgi:arginyl-tRNA synthetase
MLDERERSAIAQSVGIGAVKYADLANDRIKDYVFDWNRTLAFDSNTAPCLMYAHARICSIFGKVVDDEQEYTPSHIRLDAPAEAGGRADPVSPRRCGTHILCQYLFKLATAFNSF